MKYLLLGGSGFIGSRLAEKLSDQHQIVVVGHQAGLSFGNNIEYQQLDFTKCQDFTKYIQDIDVVVHMVSTIIPSDDIKNMNTEISDNVIPTITLLKNVSNLKKKLVFISSGGSIYGENNEKNNEDSPLNPICNYGIIKLIIEKYIEMFGRYYGLDYKIIRPSNPYNEDIQHNKKQGLVPVVIDSIIKDKEINLYGGAETVRDYIHIDDLISGIRAILDYNGAERIFNIGTGKGYTTEELIKIIEEQIGKRAKINQLPARKCDVKKNILDISRIKKETNWQPTISLEEGIRRALDSLLD